MLMLTVSPTAGCTVLLWWLRFQRTSSFACSHSCLSLASVSSLAFTAVSSPASSRGIMRRAPVSISRTTSVPPSSEREEGTTYSFSPRLEPRQALPSSSDMRFSVLPYLSASSSTRSRAPAMMPLSRTLDRYTSVAAFFCSQFSVFSISWKCGKSISRTAITKSLPSISVAVAAALSNSTAALWRSSAAISCPASNALL